MVCVPVSWLLKICAGDAQQVGDERIANGIAHAHALLAADHDVVGAQHAQLLRHDRLLDAERVLELLDAAFTAHQELENPDADRVGQAP